MNSLIFIYVTKVTKLSKNILKIKSFDCGNIDGTKRKIFTENFVPQTPENRMLDEVS